MLPCKQAHCFWYLVYINSPRITKRSYSATQKRGPNVQDRLHQPRTFQHILRPVDGLHRPPADRELPHRHSQRRPPPFRSLRPLKRSTDCVFQSRPLQVSSQTKGPGFPGPLFLRRPPQPRSRPQVRQIDRAMLWRHYSIAVLAYRIPICLPSVPAQQRTEAIRRMAAGATAPRRRVRRRCRGSQFRLIRKTRMLRQEVRPTIQRSLQP